MKKLLFLLILFSCTKVETYNEGYQTKDGKSLSYLLTTTWGEDCGYNLYCPDDSLGACYHTYTGSLAVAMGQVIKYYNYPENGRGKREYWSNYRLEAFDFQNAGFDFLQMANIANPEVARLIYACGVSLEQDFSPYIANFNCSSINLDTIRQSMIRYFKYSNKMKVISESVCGVDVDMTLLIAGEIAAGRPVIFEGYPNFGCSRVMIIDGYDAQTGKLHFNTGIWFFNSWHTWNDISFFTNFAFNNNKKVLIGVCPKR